MRTYTPSALVEGLDDYMKSLGRDRNNQLLSMQLHVEDVGLGDIDLFLKGKKLLDLGCGEAILGSYLRQNGFDAYSLDISDAVVTQLSNRYGLTQLKEGFVKGDAAHLPSKDESFDIVTANNILTDPTFLETKTPALSVFQEVRRILRNGGIFFLSDLGYTYHRFSPDIPGFETLYTNRMFYVWQKK